MTVTKSKLLGSDQYDPNRLLDSVINRMKIKNDAELARQLEVAPPVISKLRHRRIPIGATILLRLHEATEISVKELRELMGDTGSLFRGELGQDDQQQPKAA